VFPPSWVSSLLGIFLFSVLSSCSIDPIFQSSSRMCEGTYVVQAGDTLYEIARRRGCDLSILAKTNHLHEPYWLYAGQTLVLKTGSSLRFASSKYKTSSGVEVHAFTEDKVSKDITPLHLESVKKEVLIDPPQPMAIMAQPIRALDHVPLKPLEPEEVVAKRSLPKAVAWKWPAQGQLLSSFSVKERKKGISIKGKAGDPVHAIAAGKVVYQGHGVQGYGKLIMIRHDNGYLSVYGHQEKMLVHEGDTVSQGQVVGHMGLLQDNVYGMLLELRHHGQAVDPLEYLEKKKG
jgi:lipoprotein NlpD